MNAIASGILVLMGLGAAVTALVATPFGLRRSNGSTKRKEAIAAAATLVTGLLFFGLLVLILVSVEWS